MIGREIPAKEGERQKDRFGDVIACQASTSKMCAVLPDNIGRKGAHHDITKGHTI